MPPPRTKTKALQFPPVGRRQTAPLSVSSAGPSGSRQPRELTPVLAEGGGSGEAQHGDPDSSAGRERLRPAALQRRHLRARARSGTGFPAAPRNPRARAAAAAALRGERAALAAADGWRSPRCGPHRVRPALLPAAEVVTGSRDQAKLARRVPPRAAEGVRGSGGGARQRWGCGAAKRGAGQPRPVRPLCAPCPRPPRAARAPPPRARRRRRPRSRRDGRVSAGRGRCSERRLPGRCRLSCLHGNKERAERRRRARAAPVRGAPGDHGEEGRSLRVSLR